MMLYLDLGRQYAAQRALLLTPANVYLPVQLYTYEVTHEGTFLYLEQLTKPT